MLSLSLSEIALHLPEGKLAQGQLTRDTDYSFRSTSAQIGQ
jgi:hypothetical protein